MASKELLINHFFNAYYNCYKFIIDQCNDRIEGSILSCVYLDSLAGYKYENTTNKVRFIEFVLNYSGQLDIYEKISLPKLRYFLKGNHQSAQYLSILEANFKLDEYYFTQKGHCQDLSISDLRNKLNGKISNIDLEDLIEIADDFKYANILYKDYRCKLIHELRKPIDANLWDRKVPYYINISKINGIDNEHTCFRIPPEFISDTLKRCIDNYFSECLNNDIDPLAGREDEGLF
jgi:hypothetical protein